MNIETKNTEDEQRNMPISVGGTVWKATMQLRWIKHTQANEPRLGVKFSNDVGWGWPDSIVLQQKWRELYITLH